MNIPKTNHQHQQQLHDRSLRHSARIGRHSSRLPETPLTSDDGDNDTLYTSLPTNTFSQEEGHTSVMYPSDSDMMKSIPDMGDVYAELIAINQKLKNELHILHERTQRVNEKEAAIQSLEIQMEARILDLQETHKQEIRQLEEALKQKTKDNKRLTQNFEALKSSNNSLRTQVDTLQSQHSSLEKQHSCLQGRLANLLQKKRPTSSAEVPHGVFNPNQCTTTAPLKQIKTMQSSSKTKHVLPTRGVTQLVLGLLDCVAEASLQPPVSGITSSHNLHILPKDKCTQMIHQLVELIQEIHSVSRSSSPSLLPILRFLYWGLRYIDASLKQQSLITTLRRLGEHLYTSYLTTPDTHKKDTMLDNTDHQESHEKFLACLIVLISLTQVDKCARALEELRERVLTTGGKQLFVIYQATPLLLPFLRPANKAVSSTALDIYVHLCVESDHLDSFLITCGSASWFQAISLMWTSPATHQSLLEKVSILLQKLSKMKSNKRHFEVCGLAHSCQEMLRTATDSSPFLALNIKSILFNLGIAKYQN